MIFLMELTDIFFSEEGTCVFCLSPNQCTLDQVTKGTQKVLGSHPINCGFGSHQTQKRVTEFVLLSVVQFTFCSIISQKKMFKNTKILLLCYSLSSLMPDSSLSSLASSFMLRIWYSRTSLESASKNSSTLAIGTKKALKDLVMSLECSLKDRT